MRKLEDIPKKNIYKVPDGYFDQLPTVIQSRMAKEGGLSSFGVTLRVAVKYALPVAALVLVGIFWFRPEPSVETQLDKIDADQIALYLDNTDAGELSDMDEHHEGGWTTEDLNELEDEVYSNMEYSAETEDILDDIDL